MAFEPGTTVHFPIGTCAACPLRQRCNTSSNGRSVSIHPDEALLAELPERQATPAGRAQLRERVKVEHASLTSATGKVGGHATAAPARTSSTSDAQS
jgi:hypothetical protein